MNSNALQTAEERPTAMTGETAPVPWRPSPMIAAILNVPFPGAGRLYAGDVAAALLTWPAVTLASVICIAASFAVPGRLLRIALIVVVLLGIRVFLFLDAFRAARQAPAGGRAWWQQPIALIGFIAVLAFALRPLVLGAIRSRIVESNRVPSISMEPTIMAGDYVVSSRLRPGRAARGDIVIYEREGNHYLLRAVGVPGDSRYLGFIGLDRVVGHPRWICFSRDVETGAIRWGRIG